jgi:hypothetical protein
MMRRTYGLEQPQWPRKTGMRKAGQADATTTAKRVDATGLNQTFHPQGIPKVIPMGYPTTAGEQW